MNRRADDETGITLVELIIYVLLAALFLGLMAILFANGWRSQTATTERDSATGRAAVISNSLQTSIRNADSFLLEAGGTVLRAKVAVGSSGVECRAWAIVGGNLTYTSTPTIGPLDITSPATWTPLAEGVTGTFAATPAATGPRLDYNLTLTVADQTVPVAGGVTRQAKIEGEGSCWP
ncbi:hypothetical protein LG299_00360 [Microbacterium lacus]|uniref:pilus assembly FimT family protein n=1 Tax=Microbacterium lacus TaxID=415217 RepID=UPI00384FB437